MPQVQLDEVTIYKRLELAQSRVHSALCDDFNTAQVIDELSQLTNLVNKCFQTVLDTKTEQINRQYGCITSVANYIESTLSFMGLKLEAPYSSVNFFLKNK